MSSKKAIIAVGLVLFAASLACTNPISSYFSTQTAVMQTATATMWTPTPTNTPTNTPTSTPTNTPTETLTPTPDNRFYETNGSVNFSYVPPEKWDEDTSQELTGWNYKNGAAILYFYSGQVERSAADIGAGVISYWEDKGATLEDEGEFDTDAGLDSYKVVVTIAGSSGSLIRITEYIFTDGDGNYVESQYLRLDAKNKNQDQDVEQCLVTLKFD